MLDRRSYNVVRMAWQRRPGRSAFTLIELLVVIAIIAMLIAILLPSLEAARRSSKRSACMAHIKNIATSSRVYEADDPSGWGIPVHPSQYTQDTGEPTFVGAYEWGGKSGIGRNDFLGGTAPYGSKYGTPAGFGPVTRPMNDILYSGGFKDNLIDGGPSYDRLGALADTKLALDLFKCPGDEGPPRGAHCQDWIENTERSSFDHFGNSYAANIFMVGASNGTGTMFTNSPYMRPITRVPTPARTLYYEENIGRWAWSCWLEHPNCEPIVDGLNPGPTKAVRGWHGHDWTFNRAFCDGHAEAQRIIIGGTGDGNGYFQHYRIEQIYSNPGQQGGSQCIIVRGPNWQKDTLPQDPIDTQLANPGGGGDRPSYEDCVQGEDGP